MKANFITLFTLFALCLIISTEALPIKHHSHHPHHHPHHHHHNHNHTEEGRNFTANHTLEEHRARVMEAFHKARHPEHVDSVAAKGAIHTTARDILREDIQKRFEKIRANKGAMARSVDEATYKEYRDSQCKDKDFEEEYEVGKCWMRHITAFEKISSVKNNVITIDTYSKGNCGGSKKSTKTFTNDVCTYDQQRNKYVKWSW